MKTDRAFRWQLPSGVSYLEPNLAEQSEILRRKILDYHRAAGYRQISLPLLEVTKQDNLEYADTNQTHFQTNFSFFDPETAVWVSLRSDATIQVARFSSMQSEWGRPQRFCYAETVVPATPDGAGLNRQHRQYGAELLHCDQDTGSAIATDIEAVSLFIDTIELATDQPIVIVIGHGGLLHSILQQLDLSDTQMQMLLDFLRHKARVQIADIADRWAIDSEATALLLALTSAFGDRADFDAVMNADNPISNYRAYLDHTRDIMGEVQALYPHCQVQYDLADMQMKSYHTGAVFTGYCNNMRTPLGRGGRYSLESLNGSEATGFSLRSDSLLLAARQANDPADDPADD